MGHREKLLEEMTRLMSDTMGKETGSLYRDFYELEDETEIINGARGLLHDFIGPKLADKKVAEAKKRV